MAVRGGRLSRAVWRYPRVRYAVRGTQLRLQALTGRRPGEPRAPLRADTARFEPLFAGTEGTFAALVRPWTHEFGWSVGRSYNGGLESVDAELYHSVLRTYRPARVIEIGGGNSSRFALEALGRNGDGGRVVVIDPHPRTRLPRGVEHVAARVEDADPTLFSDLESGDVLFIDSSHTTGEARFHTTEILPRLRSGVLVHHHDVLFPYDRYYLGDRATYGEPDVLLDFYERQRESFEVLVGAAYVRYRSPGTLTTLVTSYRWQPGRIPGSLWVRRR